MDSDYLPLVIMLFVLLQYMDSDYLPLVIMLFVLWLNGGNQNPYIGEEQTL
jgi:hypothetical protein